jgi:hypothetical protein
MEELVQEVDDINDEDGEVVNFESGRFECQEQRNGRYSTRLFLTIEPSESGGLLAEDRVAHWEVYLSNGESVQIEEGLLESSDGDGELMTLEYHVNDWSFSDKRL